MQKFHFLVSSLAALRCSIALQHLRKMQTKLHRGRNPYCISQFSAVGEIAQWLPSPSYGLQYPGNNIARQHSSARGYLKCPLTNNSTTSSVSSQSHGPQSACMHSLLLRHTRYVVRQEENYCARHGLALPLKAASLFSTFTFNFPTLFYYISTFSTLL